MSMPVDSVVLAGHGLPALPPAREFVTSAGFGGAAALVAALLLAAVIAFALRRASKRDGLQREQQEHHFQQVRDAERHSGAVERCWQRLGPELALELLRGLLRDAETLGDDTLAGAVTVYLNQFSLVIAQQ
ncbi:hypothetical protein BB737_02395, partial [Mycobacterium avium subsp. hominissuis]